MKAWLLAILGIAAVLWILHPFALSWALTKALQTWSSANHLSFSAEKVSARLDGPVTIREIKFRSLPGSHLATSLDIRLVEWHWTGITSFFSDSERLLRDLKIRGISGLWDLSGEGRPQDAPSAGALARWMPEEILLEVPSLDLVKKGDQWGVRDFLLDVSENRGGELKVGSFFLYLSGYSKSFGPLQARTAWKNGTLWLADMEVAQGITIENLSWNFLNPAGAEISLTANCFGGSLRSDLTFQTSGETLDLAAWASNIPLDRLAPLMEIPGEITGKLAEGRLTYRGRPDRPADAEASVRLMAEDFHWNKRGWQSLEVGASLIHRRLVVTSFDLRQRENSLKFHGEISLAEGWAQIARSPFLLNFQADIRELGALAGLLGDPFGEASGRMSASGSLTGHPGELEGYLSIEASNVSFRKLPPSSLRMESVFRNNEMDVVLCDLYSRKDSASLRGSIGIEAPHQYAAELNAKIADLAAYLTPFRTPAAGRVYSGALDVKWQGDGNLKSHSGAFDVKLHEFVSGITPAGLTGKFQGTYSPQNLYFSRMEFENGSLRLGLRATVAGSGITLKDVELKSAGASLLEGAAFVPMNLFAVFGGKPWAASIDAERETYIRLSTPRELPIRSLLQLTGQKMPLEGQMRLNVEAGGLPARLDMKGEIVGRDLLWKSPGTTVPPSSLKVKISTAEGSAVLNGLLETRNLPPVTLTAHMPFGLVQAENGEWKWSNPAGAFDALLDFPRTDLGVFRPFLPKLHRLSGSVSGKMEFSGTIGAPRVNGSLDLRDGSLEISPRWPAIEKTDAALSFDGQKIQIERFTGEVGAGPFQISGGIGISDPGNPAWDLHLHGEKILLARDAGLRVRANLQGGFQGNNAAGELRGTVRLVEGRIFRRFEVTPFLVAAPVESSPEDFQVPVSPGSVPAPFNRWALDVKVDNETPFLIRGNIASGEIIPDIHLRGTLGAPVPVGRISLKDVQAFLPFTTMTIPDGRMDFLPDSPWIPFLDVRGMARTPDFEIHAYALGPLSEKKLILRSEPPLPQEAILLLLTTGIASDGRISGPGFGEAAAGQGALLLLRSFARQLDVPGLDTDAILNRLQVQSVPARALGERATMRGKFRLFDNVDLVTERDGYGFFNAGATYTWRFQ